MKTPAERKEEARQQKLEEIQEQLDAGKLVIRPMTKAERKRFPPRPPAEGQRTRPPGGAAGSGRR